MFFPTVIWLALTTILFGMLVESDRSRRDHRDPENSIDGQRKGAGQYGAGKGAKRLSVIRRNWLERSRLPFPGSLLVCVSS